MSKQLNRDWQTADGKRFQSKLVSLFDLEYGQLNLTNNQVAEALDNGDPLLVGTMGHAVVQLGFKYLRMPNGFVPNQNAVVTVFDPWPGRGMRTLSPAEMTPNTLYVFGGLHYVGWAKITALN
ncbi:MAG: hypothetical protein AB7L90_26195 [Hyphomicrobiaceae bacterium]